MLDLPMLNTVGYLLLFLALLNFNMDTVSKKHVMQVYKIFMPDFSSIEFISRHTKYSCIKNLKY